MRAPDDEPDDPGDAGDPGERAGDRAAEAAAWARAGVPYDEVDGWKQWRISPVEARAWRRAGVTEPLAAAQWGAARVTSSTVGQWMAEGITAPQAVRWHEFGFDLRTATEARAKGQTPDEAFAAHRPSPPPSLMQASGLTMSVGPVGASHPIHRFLQARVDQRLVHDYIQHGWVDDGAVAWARRGIGASDAYLWHDLGLTAAEAGRLVARGFTLTDVVRAWWPTGIPFHEVADWIGAGLTPEEAVAQRAKGVTGEQAAALRALRRGEDDEPAEPVSPALVARRGSPGAEPAGPPPTDEAAARTEITDAFTRMLTVQDSDGGLPLVDGGGNLGPSLAEARRRTGAQEGGGPTVAVHGIRFVNDRRARVVYDITVSAGPHLRDLVGGAVLVDGTWMVTRETVTELLGMAGVECPPPPPPAAR